MSHSLELKDNRDVQEIWSFASSSLLQEGAGEKLKSFALKGESANISGLPDPAKSFVIASLLDQVGGRACVLVPDEARARALHEELSAWIDPDDILTFHGRELLLMEARAANRDVELERAAVLTRVLEKEYRSLIVPADAALQRLRTPGTFHSFAIHLRSGQQIEPDRLEAELIFCGYERATQVECPGQYARRGDIIDIWAPSAVRGDMDACRISFFDIEIDELKALDAETQRSTKMLESVVLPPAREFPLLKDEWEKMAQQVQEEVNRQVLEARKSGVAEETVERLLRSGSRDVERFLEHMYFPAFDRWTSLVESSASTVLDYVSSDHTLFFIDEPLNFSKRLDAAHAGFAARLSNYLERGEAFKIAENSQLAPPDVWRAIDQRGSYLALIDLPMSGNGLPGAENLSFHARLADKYKNNPKKLAQDIGGIDKKKGAVLLYTGSDDRAEQLSLYLAEQGLYSAVILPRALPRGFVFSEQCIFVLGTEDLFGISRETRRSKKRSGRDIFFRDLIPGSLVVHEDFGVGEYRGTETIATSDGERDYLTIIYRDGTLHVPVDRVELLTAYIPAGDIKPKLAKMGGTEWQRQKERARTSIKRLVTDITALYAERRALKGHVFSPDTPWQHDFESSFPYEETEDQCRVISEIKGDMESEKVMDRLVCGDVGFGKTEVAFRALFKCVMEGKQAALLAPTTVLVRQHFNNLIERLEGFPMTVRQLSRFVSPDEQKKTIRELEEGRIDIVIATHRLLSKDVKFSDLGLLVIDEEQRFGVDHKEMIKALAPSIEVLSLSATPIPRTLHLSLSGIRDISLLEEGPEDRLPVQTIVMEYSEPVIIDAILREQARHGQVFYLFNDTRKIDAKAAELREKMPGVRFGVAHAKMSERQLEDVIDDFVEGQFDVLVCTTIIESGIDMPHVNTLVVENADRFGLSQLYQLRGRVGRSERQAYAFITYRPDRVMGEAAQKRLSAIRDFTELGSGFQIALRDLEVRGAGNLLGAEQSGHLAAIGYDLYTKMLEEAVIEEREGPKKEKKTATVVDLVTDAILPIAYVEDGGERLALYKRIALIRTIDDYRDVYDELLDRYGDPPIEAVALLDIAYIRAVGERIGFSRVKANKQHVEMILDEEGGVKMDLVGHLLASETDDYPLTFKAGYRPLILMANAAIKPKETPALIRDLFAQAEHYS